MPEVGDLIDGRYRLVRRIAEGGMGVVFEATHERLGKAVAIKFLLEQFAAAEESAHGRFEQEARAAVAIGHGSIVDVTDYGTIEDGSPYIVMELLKGRSLAALLDERKQLEVPLAAHVTCRVLSALVYAHRMGVIHRDLKPDNVFVVETEVGLPEVKILDFGISKVSPTDGIQRNVTRSGVVLGTPDYMSPEQARGEKDLDQRIDIYAVGSMLYEALAGRPPFRADNYNALLMQIALESPEPLADIVADLPSGLIAVVDKALAREREDRYSQALEMLHALAPYADQSLLPPEVLMTPEEAEPPESMALKPTVGATPRAIGPAAKRPRARTNSARATVLLVALALVVAAGSIAVVLLAGRPESLPAETDGAPDAAGASILPLPGRPDGAEPAAEAGAPDGSADDGTLEAGVPRADASSPDGAALDSGPSPALDADAGPVGAKRPRERPTSPEAGAGDAERDAASRGDARPGPGDPLERVGDDVVFQPEFR